MADLWDRARQGKPPARWGVRLLVLAGAAAAAAAVATAAPEAPLPDLGRLKERALALPWVALDEVAVEGTERLARADIVAASGLEGGASLLAIDPGAVRRRIERDPWVHSAEVRRRWPREVVIRVRERKPAALLLVSGILYLVDDEGSVFKRVEIEDRVDLPIVTGIVEDDLTRVPEHGRSILSEALRLAGRLEATAFGRGFSELHRNDGGGWRVVTAEGIAVELGEAGREEGAIAALEGALPGIRARLGEPVSIAAMGEASWAVRPGRRAVPGVKGPREGMP